MLTDNEIFKLFFLFLLYKDYITGINIFIVRGHMAPSNLTQCTRISKTRRKAQEKQTNKQTKRKKVIFFRYIKTHNPYLGPN